MEKLNDEVNSKNIKLSDETKIATVSYQRIYYGMSPCAHILVGPQTKNQNSKLYFDVAKTMVSAECLLRKKGFRFTFIGCANDGASCNY